MEEEKTISRQLAWQLKQLAKNKCASCKRKRSPRSKWSCEKCLKKKRERALERLALKKRGKKKDA